MSTNPILKISKVSRTFGAIQALKEANFEINEGEIMGLVGENGAGKSTAMRALLGMLNLRQGIITINEKDISDPSLIVRKNEPVSSVVVPNSPTTILTPAKGCWDS